MQHEQTRFADDARPLCADLAGLLADGRWLSDRRDPHRHGLVSMERSRLGRTRHLPHWAVRVRRVELGDEAYEAYLEDREPLESNI